MKNVTLMVVRRLRIGLGFPKVTLEWNWFFNSLLTKDRNLKTTSATDILYAVFIPVVLCQERLFDSLTAFEPKAKFMDADLSALETLRDLSRPLR